MTVPAKNAPRAKDTPNSLDGPIGNADSRGHDAKGEQFSRTGLGNLPKQFREGLAADNQHQNDERRDLGERDAKGLPQTPVLMCGALPPSQPANGGSITSTRTMAKSSTTSQPTAIRPFMVSRAPRASSARSSTTVLATDSARPKTSDPPNSSPSRRQHRRPVRSQRQFAARHLAKRSFAPPADRPAKSAVRRRTSAASHRFRRVPLRFQHRQRSQV